MPAQKKGARAARRADKLINKSQKNRIPLQPDGQPQGKHLSGFKGTKVDALCLCGGCHPNAKAAKDKVVIINA